MDLPRHRVPRALAWVVYVLTLTGLGCGPTTKNDPDAAPPEADASLCGIGDDEKRPLAWAMPVYNGTPEPEFCILPQQQRAVGAFLYEQAGWANECTGTVIADDVVLTAAHCVQHFGTEPLEPDAIRFVIGADALAPEATFDVLSLHPHPDYLGGDAEHDVGIAILAEGVSTSGLEVWPIRINWDLMPASFVGELVQTVGYGRTEDDPANSERWWTVEPVDFVSVHEFVVYGGGVSSVCWGDSGGPALYLFDGELRILGTVSWGDETCVGYDHFARADDNRAFIATHLGNPSSCPGLSFAGTCIDDAAAWCEDNVLVQRCCSEEGGYCTVSDEGYYRCFQRQPCNGLTFEGECRENDAYWCADGVVHRRRCEPCAQICDWTGDTLGYYCVDPD